MSTAAWTTIMILAVLWLAVAIATASFKVHQRRARLNEHLESAATSVDHDRDPERRVAEGDARGPKTWTTIIAALIVFGLALAALALLVHACYRGS